MNPFARALALVFLATGLPSVEAAPEIKLVHREKAVLRIRTPTATQVDPPKQGFVTLEVDPDTGGEVSIKLRWPGATESTLRLWGRERVAEGRKFVDLAAELGLSDGEKVRANRAILVGQASTVLFEVYRRGQSALILTLESEWVEELVLPGIRATPGREVLFLVEVQRVLDGRSISLERNQLHSFVGESVTYSFRLGETPEADSVRVELKPLRVMTDVIEIEVGISGSLPGDPGPHWVSRGEEWITSRGAASTIAIESGDPPTGYRFVVTPVF